MADQNKLIEPEAFMVLLADEVRRLRADNETLRRALSALCNELANVTTKNTQEVGRWLQSYECRN